MLFTRSPKVPITHMWFGGGESRKISGCAFQLERVEFVSSETSAGA